MSSIPAFHQPLLICSADEMVSTIQHQSLDDRKELLNESETLLLSARRQCDSSSHGSNLCIKASFRKKYCLDILYLMPETLVLMLQICAAFSAQLDYNLRIDRSRSGLHGTYFYSALHSTNIECC